MVSSQKSGKRESHLDTSLAVRAFEVSLFFWVPLANLFVNPIAIVFAILALYKQKKNPKQYGGAGYAITALIICFSGLALFLYAFIVLGSSVVLNSTPDANMFNVNFWIYAMIIFIELILIGVLHHFKIIPKSPVVQSKKDTGFATIAFILAIFSWVPLFNLLSNPIAFVFSIISLYRQSKEPQKYGGYKRSIAALIICAMWVGLFVYALIFIGPAVIFKRA